MADTKDPFEHPFGTLYGDRFTRAEFTDGAYSYEGSAVPMENLSLHPGSHVFHYGSALFEGLKAHRQDDGSVAIFRLAQHVSRMQQSAAKLHLPVPDADLLGRMITDAVAANLDAVPDPPGSLYLRPTLIGTENNIGAAATPSSEALLYVLTSPVGNYFKGGINPLTILIEESKPRTTPQFGMVKSGANYVMALGLTLEAKAEHGANQVLFAVDGDVTETGAANFFLVDNSRLVTRDLDASFLHGVTRNSLIAIGKDLGYTIEERAISVDEVTSWPGEMFLSGTAAVVAPIGSLLHNGSTITIGDGQPGANSMRLREALVNVQLGRSDDAHGWRTVVS